MRRCAKWRGCGGSFRGGAFGWLGASGKMSNLVQMLPEARFEHVIVNDSDIRVSPKYLQRVMAGFANADGRPDERVGLVTAPYVGMAQGGLWAKLGGLGVARS